VKRGDVIIAAPPSPFNKPRPALVIQSLFSDHDETVVVALITSDLSRYGAVRIPVQPSELNGLRKPSEIMVDNLQSVALDRIGGLVGEVDVITMRRVDLALRMFLGLP
jgi:mRNA interferase MazF